MKENIVNLENLSKTLEQSINELKLLYEKINENKEELKLKIQKLFSKIRNALNNREDELLLEIDKKYEMIFCNENIVKESEKLPDKIKLSLEKGKKIDKEWDDNNNDKLNLLINDCLNIENNIKDINAINENIKNLNLNNKIIELNLEENQINKFLETIKIFGNISYQKNNYEIDSKIILNSEEINFISERLENNFNGKIKYNIIYRATRDGAKTENFNNKCNGKNNQLIILKTTKGLIFGGFTGRGFQNTRERKIKDNSVFLFSLDNKKIYNIKKVSYSIYEDSINKYGIFFGKCDGNNPIYLGYQNCNMLLNQNQTCNKFNEEFQFIKDYELNGGEKYFNLEEIEVFQISKI